MFSSLTQGSKLYIYYKGFDAKLEIAEVVSKTEPQMQFGASPCGGYVPSTMDITVSTSNGTTTFPGLNSNANFATYNNGEVLVSETRESVITEVENAKRTNQDIVDNYDKYVKSIENYDNILKQLNPQYAKEADREKRIGSLETKVIGIEDKIDKVLNLLSKDK